MEVVNIDRKTWLEKYSKNAYMSVFGREDHDLQEASLFDAALMVMDEESNCPIIYTTIKQTTAKSVFIEFGGSFPDYRGTAKVKPAFEKLCAYLKEAGAEFVTLSTKNTNIAMNRLALSVGFIPSGMNFNKEGAFVDYVLSAKGEY